jgi:hypothetical protein
MKINGLMYGRRTTQWIGTFEFTDPLNNLTARLEFSKGPGIFSRNALPIDCFEGTIMHNGTNEKSKVQGSWLEFIRFDGRLYWELETCDTVRPVPADDCLPSDCRYREVSITFRTGDLDRA